MYASKEDYLKSLRAVKGPSPLIENLKKIRDKQPDVPVVPQAKKTIFYSPTKTEVKPLPFLADNLVQGAKTSVQGLGNALSLANIRASKTPGLSFNKDLNLASEMIYKKNIEDQSQKAKDFQEKYDVSGGMQFAGQVAQGIGGMAPAIGANLIAPGSGLPIIFGSAMGNKSAEAVREGATLEKATAAGILSGATEVITEKAFGAIPGLGKGFADDVLKVLTKSKAGQIAAGSIGEGFEEYVSSIADNYISQIYNSDDRDVLTTLIESQPEAVYSGLVGSVTSMVLQGGSNMKLPTKKQNTQVTKQVQSEQVTQPESTQNVNVAGQTQQTNIETPEETNVAQNAQFKPTEKSKNYQSRAENEFRREIAKTMEIRENKNLTPLINQATNEIKTTGNLSEQTANEIFEKAYAEGTVEDDLFYKEYQAVKEDLKNTTFKLTDQDKRNISNFNEFAKGVRGKLRLSSDAGVYVDQKYQELSNQHPELFPELNNVDDQINQIFQVYNDIAIQESPLSQQGPDYKQYARNEFDKAMSTFKSKILDVVRYETVKPEDAPVSMDEATALRNQIDEYERQRDKVYSKMLLPEDEKITVDRLLNDEITLDQIPNTQNADRVRMAYEVSKPLYDARNKIKTYNKQAKQKLRDLAKPLIEGMEMWSDRKFLAGAFYNIQTAERNIRKLMSEPEANAMIDAYFTPVHENEALRNKFKNKYRDLVRSLQLTAEEAMLTQQLGERIITEVDLDQHPSKEKIINAVEQFRTMYDELLREVNVVLVRNGYNPIEYRKNYFPHFQDEETDSVLKKLASKVGFNWRSDALPTDIAGLTHTFRPGKTWFGNALSRKGNKTKYNAIEGFDSYIEGISNLIFHTDDIQRLRALETEIRYQKSDEGRKAQIDEIYSRDLSTEELDDELDKIYSKDNSLGNFVTWLRGYTDTLANKKSIGDREFEYNLGRGMYDLSRKMQNRVAANMVALNPGSWLTNFIPLTQAYGQVSTQNMVRGIFEATQNIFQDDGFDSVFITNRKGSDPLVRTRTEKTADLLSKPMKWIDEFTTQAVVRAKYYENYSKGMPEDVALKDADAFAAKVMADRSKGSLPLIFERKNPLLKLFTQFQVEVNNQLWYLFGDAPRELRKEGVKALAMAFMKYAIASYIFNLGFEKLVGRKPALSPLDMAFEGYKSIKNSDGNLWKAGSEIIQNVGEELPFSSGLMGGGRIPIQAAIPNLVNLGKIAFDYSGDTTPEMKKDIMLKEALKTLYYIPPVGGGQIKKAVEGGINLARGGSYNQTNDGERLRFLVAQTPGNTVKSLLFGQYSVPEAREYFDNKRLPLSANQTAGYKQAVDAKIDARTAYEGFLKMREIKPDKDSSGKTIVNSESVKEREYIDSLNLTAAQKKVLYEAYGINKTIKELDNPAFEAYKKAMERKLK